jgi:hypothetical protein
MVHPLVDQLQFTRSEWLRGIEGVSEDDAVKHFGRMNCISWNVGHLAWQENMNWVRRLRGAPINPELTATYAMGAPMSSPRLKDSLAFWYEVTRASDEYLAGLTPEGLLQTYPSATTGALRVTGSALLRMTYHYWYHLGEILAIRQMLEQTDLPQFVGPGIDREAAYRPE